MVPVRDEDMGSVDLIGINIDFNPTTGMNVMQVRENQTQRSQITMCRQLPPSTDSDE
jgi:hypothetical protein